MSDLAERFAREAEALVGTPFRLHGRSAATGLDCVGLVAAALARCDVEVAVPTGYCLRNLSIERWIEQADLTSLRQVRGAPERGDILVARPGAAQHHLLVAAGSRTFIHAHASLRRVVSQHGLSGWPITHHWRLA